MVLHGSRVLIIKRESVVRLWDGADEEIICQGLRIGLRTVGVRMFYLSFITGS